MTMRRNKEDMTDAELALLMTRKAMEAEKANGRALQRITELESELGEHRAWLAAIAKSCGYNGHPMNLATMLKKV